MSEAALKEKIKKAIVAGLKLQNDPASIRDDEPLFGGGLSLDSVDILTLVTVIEESFDIRIQDHEVEQLNSVNQIAEFVTQKQIAP